MLSKNVNKKKCAPKLVFFNEETLRKIPMIFDFEGQLLAHLDISPLH